MAKSETLIVMQNVNPAARWVQGALCDDCLVGPGHAVLMPMKKLVIFKQDTLFKVFRANVEGS